MMLYDCRSAADRDRGIAAAIEAAKNGELVVMPTDTLYGIGCDAFSSHAVNSLFNAKGRGRTPPPVLVGSRHTLNGLVLILPRAARDLADAFWPGPLTIIVDHAPSLQWDLGETNGQIAVRQPLHPVALEVLREVGPMAVSAANKTGRPAPLTAADAQEQMGYSVRTYLEAGPAVDPVPSTIVDVTGDVPRMLRAGAIPLEKLRDVVPDMLGQED
ncbi:tRNA threonylcarbamoyl adenosine modification protein (Sua5/YciO/YrdC/YwlC family) [Catenuloplanes niger]|uniref:L-threonylcarbamoyladenylate synthase n=2 Tax=Micromonosporaceae TaxID=28056 RepID=A0AAE3ZRC5_9ACTN|nr:tRNA threonylcarbamoyl adenosine modification protein (Sua5/YciO/YrdC/YwlC family) [Catenuloplanes niger]